MPLHRLVLDILWMAYEDNLCLAVPLLFPELSELGHDRSNLRRRLIQHARSILVSLPVQEVYQRQPHELPELRKIAVEIEPAFSAEDGVQRLAWTNPTTLEFHYVVWRHDGAAIIAYVPGLDIEVVVKSEEVLADAVRREVLFAIRRRETVTTLETLWRLQHAAEVDIERCDLEAEIKTPKQSARTDEPGPSNGALSEIATNMTHARHPDVFGRERLVETLADYLTGRPPRSVLLVGPSGVGKTALVHELCRRRAEWGLGPVPFWTTSGARIVAGACGFGVWEERCGQMCREVAKTKALLHLGNLVELMRVGKGEGQDLGVGDFLTPVLQRGDILAIAECTEEEFVHLDHHSPRILHSLARVNVDEPSVEGGREILRKCAGGWSRSKRATLSDEALTTLDRLHRRYATYSAYPGRPLRFLRHLIEISPEMSTVASPDVITAFSKETGLPVLLLDDAQSMDLGNTQQWLANRVKGQAEAVDAVVHLLAGVKAGTGRPNQPIASLLFVGPTGVGKTEMAKALAEFLYQDRRRITRIDMSEYADVVSVERLIGGGIGSEGILTAKVREQPFGVVLLDEFEKAHPRLFDLLLQVLGEGRLTDSGGRLANFSNSVVIMTSNLGTESFKQGSVGFSTESGSSTAAHHFIQAVREFVRPELFNRVDRIVPFLPLSKTTLVDIAARELDLFLSREGIHHRNVEVDFSLDVAEGVVELGHDPRYGARPIKRTIERHLAAPLAAALAGRGSDDHQTATVRYDRGRFRVSVRTHSTSENPARVSRAATTEVARHAGSLRREAHRVRRSSPVMDIVNEIYRCERQLAFLSKTTRNARLSARNAKQHAEVAARLEQLRKLASLVDGLVTDATGIEDLVLEEYYENRVEEVETLAEEWSPLNERLHVLYKELYCHNLPISDRAVLVVYGKANNRRVEGIDRTLFELAQGYWDVAQSHDCRGRLYVIQPRETTLVRTVDKFPLGNRESADPVLVQQANGTHLQAVQIARPSSFFGSPKATPIGIALELLGSYVFPLLAHEGGLHVFGSRSAGATYMVHVSSDRMLEYRPPARIDEPIGMQQVPLRRVYDAGANSIEDKELGGKQFWSGKRLDEVIGRLCSERLLKTAKEWLHAD